MGLWIGSWIVSFQIFLKNMKIKNTKKGISNMRTVISKGIIKVLKYHRMS